MFMNEETWSCVIVGVAEIIFEVAAWSERNPVFGSVYIWALAAILDETLKEKPEQENLIATLSTTIGVHAISMATLAVYLIFEVFEPWY